MKVNYNVVIVVILIVVVGALYYTYSDRFSSASGTGRAVFALTDPAANMGSISSVRITVDSVEAHLEGGGWVTVSSTPRTYDLLQLKAEGRTVVLADVQLQSGTYEQVRLVISKVEVTDDKGVREAKLPSSELKIVGGFTVAPNMTSAATFDFVTNESLHITGNDKYVMAPVVRLETREDADVSVQGNDVEISGGRVKTSVKVGMNEKGEVGVGLELPANANINVNANGLLSLA